jgi:hypothetical protein
MAGAKLEMAQHTSAAAVGDGSRSLQQADTCNDLRQQHCCCTCLVVLISLFDTYM